MKVKEIKKRLQKAINEAPINLLDDISQHKVQAMNRHDYITRQEPVKKKSLKPMYAFAMLSVILAFTFLVFYQGFAVTTQVYIDINPGIEIDLNRNDKVIGIVAINVEEDIFNTINYNRKHIYQVIPMLLETLREHGYIKEDKNIMLVSIKSESVDRNKEQIKELNSLIKDYFAIKNSSVMILKQEITGKDDTQDDFYKNILTTGKYTFIKNITEMDSSLNFDDLAVLSLEELVGLSKSISLDLKSIIKSDEDVYQYYDDKKTSPLSLERAMDIALELTEGGIVKKIELEEDDGRLYYEIEVEKGSQEFDIVIDAYNGQILEFEKDSEYEHDYTEVLNDILDVSEVSVIALNFTNGGIIIELELDYDNNIAIYEVIVFSENTEYDLLINAYTGEVIKVKFETVDDRILDNDLISIEEAQKKALELTEGGVVKEIKLEEDDGRLFYEIEVEKGSQEFDIIIDAYSGQVLEFEKEDESENKYIDDSSEILDAKKISAIALNFTNGGIVIELELNHDNDIAIYEVIVVSENTEYDFLINAHTGEIIKVDFETIDDKTFNNQLVNIEEALIKALDLTKGGLVIEVELNEDDGKFAYEIEIKKDEFEFKIKIDGQSGEIISFEKE